MDINIIREENRKMAESICLVNEVLHAQIDDNLIRIIDMSRSFSRVANVAYEAIKKMKDAEREAQRQSFAKGNAAIDEGDDARTTASPSDIS